MNEGGLGNRELRDRYRAAILKPLFDAWKDALYPVLIEASRAHVVALTSGRVLRPDQAARLLEGLDTLGAMSPADLVYDPDIEDVYFFLERALAGRLGAEAAGNLQLARSRNDLDAGAFRMVARAKLLAVVEASIAAGRAAAARARDGRDALVLARTHGQPAQPTTLGHVLAAYAETVVRNLDRYRLAYAQVNCSPLGACALAGTSFALDRDELARLLGFDGLVVNTYDAVVTADYALTALSACAIALSHDSRLLAMLEVWGTGPRPSVRMAPGFVQISSMMPQKRNIVFVEHLRARATRAAGLLAGAAAGVAATPFEDDNRATSELQEDLWRTLDDAAAVSRILDLALSSMAVGEGTPPEEIVASGATTTEVMDALVRRHGVSQRQAHAVVSAMVERAPDPRTWTEAILAAVTAERLGRAVSFNTAEIQALLDPRTFVRTRVSAGGPAPGQLDAELAAVIRALDGSERWAADARERLGAARAALRRRCAEIV
ncbi:MAG TPA: lyase family protein, partial [bacterium]|nr:lyase family protein [bacterium]